jgi:choloylglycine hydrolase
MAGYQYSMWILGNFANVAEVKAAYNHVVLAPTVVSALGMAPPVHFRIADKTGASVVVEPIGGKLVIYDDPFGVLTNSPTFDWQMTNLNNYNGLSPVNRAPMTLDGYALNGKPATAKRRGSAGLSHSQQLRHPGRRGARRGERKDDRRVDALDLRPRT